MIITTQELIERYNLPYSTFQIKNPKLIEAGALGNKARQAAVNRHHATACEEHF